MYFPRKNCSNKDILKGYGKLVAHLIEDPLIEGFALSINISPRSNTVNAHCYVDNYPLQYSGIFLYFM